MLREMIEELGDKTTVILTRHRSMQEMPCCCKSKVRGSVFQLLHGQLFFTHNVPAELPQSTAALLRELALSKRCAGVLLPLVPVRGDVQPPGWHQ